MSEVKANEQSPQYITSTDLVDFEGRILASIATIKDNIDQKIETRVTQEVDTQMREERRKVQAQVSQLTKTVSEVTDLVSTVQTQLVIINTKLESITNIPALVGDISERVSMLQSTIEERGKVAEIQYQRLDERNHEQDKELRQHVTRMDSHSRRLDESYESISGLKQNQSMLKSGLDGIKVTIFGDGSDNGMPSLFGMMNELKQSVEVMQTTNTKTQNDILALATSNGTQITSIQAAIDAQAQAWQKRKDAAWDFANNLIKSKLAWLVLGSLVAGGVFGDEAATKIVKLLSGIDP